MYKTLRHISLTLASVGLTIFATLLCGCSNTNERRQQAQTLLKEGQTAYNGNEPIVAFGKLQSARTEFEQLADSNGFFEATVYLSMVYDFIGQPDKGYELLKNLRFIDLPNKDTYGSQYYLRQKAYFTLALAHDVEQGEVLNQQCIDYTRRNYPNDTALTYIDMANMVELYCMVGRYDEARRKADDLLAKTPGKNDVYLSELYYGMGLIALHDGENSVAYRHFETSESISRKYGAFGNEMNSLDKMMLLDSVANNLKAYIKHKQAFDNVKEKVAGSEVYYKIALLQEQHKMDLLKQQTEKSRTVHLLSIALLLLVLLAVVAAFVAVYRNTKTKQRMAQLERQKLDNAIEMERMEKELLKLKMEKKGEQLDRALKENVSMSIRMAEHNDEDSSAQLERQITEIEETLSQRLEPIYPTLTHNDLRLLSFIKLGISQQDTAAALNITTESLAKAKYRLRKKLKIEKAEGLETFTKSID